MQSKSSDFALLSWDRKVLLADEQFLKFWRFKCRDCGPDGFSVQEPIGPERKILRWILLWDGTLVEVQEVKRGPRCPRFLKWLCNWTQIFYCTATSRNIALGDLAKLCSRSSAGLKKPLEIAIKKHGEGKVIDRRILWDDLIGQIMTYDEV